MARIKGKFCPLTDELGNDERFILNSTDLDKLMYILVMYTCHMTYHQAPTDARFYKIRYGLRAKLVQIKGSLERLRGLYKGLSWVDGKLSLLNSATYKIQPVQKCIEVEEEREEEREGEIEIEQSCSSFDALEAFNVLLAEYPIKIGQSRARQMFFQWQVTSEMFIRMHTAIKSYKAHLASNDWKTAMNFNTFLESWTDWENHVEQLTPEQKDAAIMARLKEPKKCAQK